MEKWSFLYFRSFIPHVNGCLLCASHSINTEALALRQVTWPRPHGALTSTIVRSNNSPIPKALETKKRIKILIALPKDHVMNENKPFTEKAVCRAVSFC